MIIFENDGEIDPRLVMLFGVNVKEQEDAIGFFGTGLKYSVASLLRWNETLLIQSGQSEFSFSIDETQIRGRSFGLVRMHSRFDRSDLGFTTELGKRWEPWMVYRELWCNAHDEPGYKIYEADEPPSPVKGLTRIITDGPMMAEAHATRDQFILDKSRAPLQKVEGLEVYSGQCERIFYRGIAVQKLAKPSLYTYNITSHLYLTEDRTAGSWETDPIIARGLGLLDDSRIIEDTILAKPVRFESQLDYCHASTPSRAWIAQSEALVAEHPFDVPSSVRAKFVREEVSTCPTCGRAF